MPCDVTTTTTTTTTTTAAPEYVAPCPSDYAVTGEDALVDHGITGTGFLVDLEVRVDSNINNVFYAQYPADPGSPEYCDFQPTITVQTGQCIIFQQIDISNGTDGFTGLQHPFYIATSLEGSPGSYEYTQGVEYRMGVTGVSGDSVQYIPGNQECSAGADCCANVVWCVDNCTPSTLYYRCRTHNNMGGVILVEGTAGCTGATGCTEHERPFTEILPLVLSDTFYEWYEATNEIITAINPLKVMDVTLRGGLTEKYNQGGDLHIEIDAGEGLRIWPPDLVTGSELTTECHDGKIRLDFFGLPEAAPTGPFEPFEDGATGSAVWDDDLYAFERIVPYQGVFPDDIAGGFFKVKAENMLPHTVAGDHRFTGLITFENPVTDVSSTKVVIDDINIELGHSPYLEMVVEYVSGIGSNLTNLTGGASHDPDGDGIYNEGDATGEMFEQIQYFFDTGVADLTDVTGSQTAKATLLSHTYIEPSEPRQAIVILRSYNDIPFNAVTGNITTSRSGYELKIISIKGQAGSDADIDGGGITLVSNNLQSGNKTIIFRDGYNAWEINQNFRIDNSHALLTPFNITHEVQGNTGSITGGTHWRVHQYITGGSPLPLPVGWDPECTNCTVPLDNDDWGLLHFSYLTGQDESEVPTLSLLPCGGIYIHNIACSPQFSVTGSPCNVVLGNQYGLIDKTWTERLFFLGGAAKNNAIGDVVRVVDGGDTITGAQADSADNAEVLGIVVEHVAWGETPCGTKSEGVIVAYGGEVDWKDGMGGLSTPLTKGAIYYLDPVNQGKLTAIEPLDVGEVRKPMVLAVTDSTVLIVNYEGVINGDYFDENPVTRLTELRDVTISNPTGGDIVFYDGTAREWVNESIQSAIGSLSSKAMVTGGISGGDASGNVTMTFPGAYQFTSLPANQLFVIRGTMIAYDYGITGTTGTTYPVTGGPKHEISPFVGAFFNLDDHATTGNMDGSGSDTNYITGSLGIGTIGKALELNSGIDWVTGSSSAADFRERGNYSSIDLSTGDISLTFNIETASGTDWYYGITAWLEFLGGDTLPPT